MPIYREENGKLKKVDAVPVLKEKELQILVENNLEEVLEMYFLATEFVTTLGGRIDTLAVDTLGAPVIIEYKRNRNDNVINQALSYLKWLKAQKEEFFEMLILKKLGSERAKSLRIDWKNPRVICIAENFNKYDLDTVEVVPIRIELYKYRLYENGIFTLDPQHVLDQKSQPTVEIKTSGTSTLPSLDDHLAKASEETKELFLELRSRILEMDENVQEKATTMYISYKATKTFAEIHLAKNHILIYLRPIDFQDAQNMVEKIPDSYNWTLNKRVYLRNSQDFEYIFGLIEQSYQDVI